MLQTISPQDPVECEKRSAEVLGAIRCFIDGLRSAPNHTSLPLQLQPANATVRCIHSCGSLLTHLSSTGAIQIANGLNDDDQQPQQQQQQQQQHLQQKQNCGETFPDVRIGSLLTNQDNADERKHILFKVVLPLLSHLEQCYAVMDELPSAQPPYTVKNNNKNKAPPPLGMLSLNDYTNVACLLEFAVSISLIPLLEHPNMYLPPLTQSSNGNNTQSQLADTYMHKIDTYSTLMIQKRSQTIPKSLAGRISKMILTWGTLYATNNHVSLYDNLLNGDFFSDDNAINLRQSYQFYRLFQTYNEMTILAISIGRLILLDRFRPMLLPRHLSDVYFAILIAERLRWYLSKLESCVPGKHSVLATLIESEKRMEKQNHEHLQSLQMSLLFCPIPFPSSVISTLSIRAPQKKFVDSREAALAYRTLLSGGASMVTSGTSSPAIPTWLRIRIGQSLTKLAQDDVRSVVDVFVASARGPGNCDDENTRASVNDDIMTGSAARLACALCTEPMSIDRSSRSAQCKTQQFQEQLWSQFVSFLVVESQSSNDLIRSRSSVAMHLTFWATIRHVSLETLQASFVRKLASGLIPVEVANSQEPISHQLTAIQSISAIATWLSMIPSSLDMHTQRKIKIILLEPCVTIHGQHLTIFGQVIRLAALFSCRHPKSFNAPLVEEIGNENTDCAAMRKVDKTLEHILAFLCRLGGTALQSCHDSYNIIALDLLKSLLSNELDKQGFCFHESEVQPIEPCVMVYQRSIEMTDISDVSHLVGAVECRVKCLVRAFITISQSWEDWCPERSDSEAFIEKLASSLFRLSLLLHYERFAENDCNDRQIAHTFGLNTISASEKIAMKMVASITLAVMSESCPPSFLLGCGQKNSDSDSSVLEVLGLIIRSAAARMNVAVAKTDTDEDSELFSTVSIVLSLLVALLELGAEKRSQSDEFFFETIIPFLRTLSSVNNDEENSYSPELTRSAPELAEMASHAMALIVARGEVESSKDDQMSVDEERSNRKDEIFHIISQAELDLQSSQPPIRARGVVTLRHIARSLEHRYDDGLSESLQDELKSKALILDVSEPASTPLSTLSAKEELALISRTLAKICLNVLGDPESYVYLASIQTLVAIGDICPSQIMPLIGTAIAKGRLRITVATADANLESEEVSLSPEQRIKATEALIFMIRRRGGGIFLYGPLLLSTMLFGHNMCQDGSGSTLQNSEQTARLIQRQTHLYFTGREKGNTDNNGTEERKVRLNTGGPIFSLEESDLLRAGAISVVCELVSTLSPITIASHCHILVKLAMDAMQLDTSRPVRRVAACLARDLYACVMRDITTPCSGKYVESNTCSLAVAIVDANEEKLYNLLMRCVSGNELAKQCFVDPSTQCRSQEAIEIRQELESMGVLRAAAAILLERSNYPEIIIEKLRLK